MGSVIRDFGMAFLMGFLLPAAVLVGSVAAGDLQTEAAPEETVCVSGTRRYSVLLHREGEPETGDLDDYLVGVLLAEMPAWFEPEALKAQAVAARTFSRKAYETGGKHGDGSVCTDPGCCQGYLSEAAYLAKGGTTEELEKVRRAVEETSSLVLTYGDTLIEAVYFACSGGSTEAAVEVWGSDYPYLVAVDSPGEENAEGYRGTIRYSPQRFAELVDIQPEGDPKYWIGITDYTAGGSVRWARIGHRKYSGTELRGLLGLPSAAFTMEVVDGVIEITTKGYGHRVGMSQYGAQAMAERGCTFREILSHYYPGTELRSIDGA